MNLTAKDAEILRILQEGNVDGRKEIAEQVGMSSTTLWRRINELENAGLIKKQVTLLDAEKIGFPVCVFVFVMSPREQTVAGTGPQSHNLLQLYRLQLDLN